MFAKFTCRLLPVGKAVGGMGTLEDETEGDGGRVLVEDFVGDLLAVAPMEGVMEGVGVREGVGEEEREAVVEAEVGGGAGARSMRRKR